MCGPFLILQGSPLLVCMAVLPLSFPRPWNQRFFPYPQRSFRLTSSVAACRKGLSGASTRDVSCSTVHCMRPGTVAGRPKIPPGECPSSSITRAPALPTCGCHVCRHDENIHILRTKITPPSHLSVFINVVFTTSCFLRHACVQGHRRYS